MSASEHLLLKELKEKGYRYRNIDKLFEQKTLQADETEAILKWLEPIYREDVATADILVRSLVSAKHVFDPSLLIRLFDESDLNFHLKSGIGVALAYGRTTDISAWLRKKLGKEPFAPQNWVLIEGLFTKGGFTDVNDYMSFMRSIFDNYQNESVLKTFAKYGNKEDIKFLEEKAKHCSDARQSKKIGHAIKKIATRNSLL